MLGRHWSGVARHLPLEPVGITSPDHDFDNLVGLAFRIRAGSLVGLLDPGFGTCWAGLEQVKILLEPLSGLRRHHTFSLPLYLFKDWRFRLDLDPLVRQRSHQLNVESILVLAFLEGDGLLQPLEPLLLLTLFLLFLESRSLLL